jgi:hypothetical protein
MSTTAPHDSLYSTEFFNHFLVLIEEVAKWSQTFGTRTLQGSRRVATTGC